MLNFILKTSSSISSYSNNPIHPGRAYTEFPKCAFIIWYGIRMGVSKLIFPTDTQKLSLLALSLLVDARAHGRSSITQATLVQYWASPNCTWTSSTSHMDGGNCYNLSAAADQSLHISPSANVSCYARMWEHAGCEGSENPKSFFQLKLVGQCLTAPRWGDDETEAQSIGSVSFSCEN
jgi:hypothetical protein